MGREQDWKEIEKTQLNYEQGLVCYIFNTINNIWNTHIYNVFK